jgi:hypothetical protein
MSLYLRRSAAAKYVQEKWGLPCAPRTLAKLACVASDGLAMYYFGRIPLYTEESLDNWALKRVSAPQRSTSDRQGRANEGADGLTTALQSTPMAFGMPGSPSTGDLDQPAPIPPAPTSKAAATPRATPPRKRRR